MSLQISANPSRLCLYHATDNFPNLGNKPIARKKMPKNVRKKNEMSRKAQIRIKAAANWMLFLSRERNAYHQNKKVDNQFSVSFVTLHLPSKQMHSHSEITKRCLNIFIMYLRRKHNVKNYIWRAEIQKNGNIHYHLVIDQWIHYLAIRKYWCNALATLGYLSAYANTYKNMSFKEYRQWRHREGLLDEKKIKKAFDFGTQSAWLSPNCTDVHKCRDIRKLAAYIGKYISKDFDQEKTGPYADSLAEMTGRLWYCSTSLSRLGNLKMPPSQKNISFFKMLQKTKGCISLVFEWSSLVFFNIKSLPFALQSWLNSLFYVHAVRTGYILPN